MYEINIPNSPNKYYSYDTFLFKFVKITLKFELFKKNIIYIILNGTHIHLLNSCSLQIYL